MIDQRTKANVILCCGLLVSTAVAFGGIEGSDHDFSGEAWSTDGEICLPCHTPHNADTSQLDAPLWNHQTSAAIFTLYDSPTLKGTPEQPRGPSKTCLSCHDGTVALDSFGGSVGSTYIDGDALIGADLSDDHPISIKWDHAIGQRVDLCFNCHTFSPFKLLSEVPFFDGYLECASCHDAHNGTELPGMLRKTIQGSALCLHCHAK